jgi:hypothetical protein
MGEARPPLSTVEGVRDELRRLGYLDSGLDRFVLGGAGTASPWRASLQAATRVGVVGGVVFGLAATLAAGGLDPRILREPQDLLVLALYLALAFALLTGLTALAGGLLAGWARRAGHQPGKNLARNLGVAVALLAVALLALWWRSHFAGSPLLGQAAALLVGLALSFALGRFASLAAIGVLSAGGVSDRLPHASLSRRLRRRRRGGRLALVHGGTRGPGLRRRADRPARARARDRRARAPDGGAHDGPW